MISQGKHALFPLADLIQLDTPQHDANSHNNETKQAYSKQDALAYAHHHAE